MTTLSSVSIATMHYQRDLFPRGAPRALLKRSLPSYHASCDNLSEKIDMATFGFLNINKPAGVTSRWVVDRVQRLVRPDKAGHAGTLDPLATGVLVVAIGQATRLIEYVQRMRKQYLATFLLGRSSDTE